MTARRKSWPGQSATFSTHANACAFFAPPGVFDALTVIYTLIAAGLIWLQKFESISGETNGAVDAGLAGLASDSKLCTKVLVNNTTPALLNRTPSALEGYPVQSNESGDFH